VPKIRKSRPGAQSLEVNLPIGERGDVDARQLGFVVGAEAEWELAEGGLKLKLVKPAEVQQ